MTRTGCHGDRSKTTFYHFGAVFQIAPKLTNRSYIGDNGPQTLVEAQEVIFEVLN